MNSMQLTLPSGLHAHALEAGSPTNPPLVLVHGYPASSLLWRHCIPPLAEHFHVLAPDLPGHGRSAKPVDVDYDLDLFVSFLRDVLDAAGIATTDLVVHDLGGMVGLGFAARHPDRVRRLVVMDTAPYVQWPLVNRLVVGLARTRLFAWRMTTPGGFRSALRTFCVHDPKVITREVSELHRAPWVADRASRLMLRKVIAMPPERITEPRENLARITAPTLVLWAANDLVLPVRIGRQLQRDLPDAELEVVPECGHFLQEERPDEVVRHLLRFLGPGQVTGRTSHVAGRSGVAREASPTGQARDRRPGGAAG